MDAWTHGDVAGYAEQQRNNNCTKQRCPEHEELNKE